MSSYKVEEIPGPQLLLGEGPHWDVERQCLYYVGLVEAMVLRLDYKENKVYSAIVENCTWASFIIPVKGHRDKFVVGDGLRLVLVSWDGRSEVAKFVKVIAELDGKEQGNRWNDGKVDRKGRLFAGTMIQEEKGNAFEVKSGAFYRFNAKHRSFSKQFDQLFISNGLAWNDKTNKFYHADTGAYEIREFDVDENGDLSNGKVWFDFKENGNKPACFPDGMTIDAEGNLYVAVFNAAKVFKINSRREVELEIDIPTKQITSVAFGGPNLDELYVTTARQYFETQPPPAGATFKVTGLGVKGLPMNAVELRSSVISTFRLLGSSLLNLHL